METLHQNKINNYYQRSNIDNYKVHISKSEFLQLNSSFNWFIALGLYIHFREKKY